MSAERLARAVREVTDRNVSEQRIWVLLAASIVLVTGGIVAWAELDRWLYGWKRRRQDQRRAGYITRRPW